MDERKVWEHQVDHSLFSIAKLDITNDGQDEVVVCAWDGTTYVLDHLRNVVRFKFEDNVCAGSLDLAQNITSTVSSTLIFSRKIFIYHNINLPAIPPSNVITTMATQMMKSKRYFESVLILVTR